jgi:hypothetical protein
MRCRVSSGLFAAARFHEANCTNIYYRQFGCESSSCGDECSSSFPCYKVYVNYEDNKHGVAEVEKVIYENELTLVHYSSVSVPTQFHCMYRCGCICMSACSVWIDVIATITEVLHG